MTHPAPAIAGVVSLVAIVGVIGALRLSPDAGTDKLVDNGSRRLRGHAGVPRAVRRRRDRRPRRGGSGEAAADRAHQPLLALEGCLAGNAGRRRASTPPRSASEIGELGATRVVFGPATFLNEAAARSNEAIQQQLQSLAADAERRRSCSRPLQQFAATGLSPADVCSGLSIDNTSFVQSIVFDDEPGRRPTEGEVRLPVPVRSGALISIRLQPDVSDDTRREAIDLIRDGGRATTRSRFATAATRSAASRSSSQGLADELGGQIVAPVRAPRCRDGARAPVVVFGPPLRLLPLADRARRRGLRLRAALAARRHADDGVGRGAAGGDRARRSTTRSSCRRGSARRRPQGSGRPPPPSSPRSAAGR